MGETKPVSAVILRDEHQSMAFILGEECFLWTSRADSELLDLLPCFIGYQSRQQERKKNKKRLVNRSPVWVGNISEQKCEM